MITVTSPSVLLPVMVIDPSAAQVNWAQRKGKDRELQVVHGNCVRADRTLVVIVRITVIVITRPKDH